ncbi:MAG: endonuclease/exonuclease/phosphatase family protein, partial [Runella sp.]
LVVGDLNITPWSVFYQRMITHSGLSNCRDGFGWQPTWHYWGGPMRIPIDHALVNAKLETVDFRTEGYNKSDHLPLVIDLRFKP